MLFFSLIYALEKLKCNTTGVIQKSISMLSTELVPRKAAVDRGYSYRLRSTDVDRGTTSLNELKVRYDSVYFYIFWIQTSSEIVCYCLSGLGV